MNFEFRISNFKYMGATVVVVYLNVLSVLQAKDERYYAALKVLMDSIL